MFFIDFSTLITGELEDMNYSLQGWETSLRLMINDDPDRLHLAFCYLAGNLRLSLDRLGNAKPDSYDGERNMIFALPQLLRRIIIIMRLNTWVAEGQNGNVLPPEYPFGANDTESVIRLILDKIKRLSDHEFADWMFEQTKGPLPFPTAAKLRPISVAT
jgi:hypothetical protein